MSVGGRFLKPTLQCRNIENLHNIWDLRIKTKPGPKRWSMFCCWNVLFIIFSKSHGVTLYVRLPNLFTCCTKPWYTPGWLIIAEDLRKYVGPVAWLVKLSQAGVTVMTAGTAAAAAGNVPEPEISCTPLPRVIYRITHMIHYQSAINWW